MGAPPASIPQAPPVPQNLQPAPPPPAVSTSRRSCRRLSSRRPRPPRRSTSSRRSRYRRRFQPAATRSSKRPPATRSSSSSRRPSCRPRSTRPPPAAAHAFAPVAPPEPTFAAGSARAAQAAVVVEPRRRGRHGEDAQRALRARRVSGDELITSLFESMHDLHFLRDALDGGQFCLALATEVLPSRAAIIHFFDIEKREWVVACTRGKEMGRLLTMRAPENDEILRDCARKRRRARPCPTPPMSRPSAIASSAGRAASSPRRSCKRSSARRPRDHQPARRHALHRRRRQRDDLHREQYAEYLGSRASCSIASAFIPPPPRAEPSRSESRCSDSSSGLSISS